MACGTLGGFLFTWPLGWLSDRIDRRLAIIGAAIIAAVTLLTIIALVPNEASRYILYLCVAIFGGTIVPTYSVVMAHVNDSVGADEFVAASGGLLIVQGAGAVFGPIVAGIAMSMWNRGLSVTLITAQLLIAGFGIYRLCRRAAPPEKHKGTFVVEPVVPVATTLEAAQSRVS
jgi:MFS family permease